MLGRMLEFFWIKLEILSVHADTILRYYFDI